MDGESLPRFTIEVSDFVKQVEYDGSSLKRGMNIAFSDSGPPMKNHVFLLMTLFSKIEFFPYSDHGDLWWKDGEYFARKVSLKQMSLFADMKRNYDFRVWDESAWSRIPMLPSMSL